jgi:pimeloyl-ACP methyl ester carboxylesterase
VIFQHGLGGSESQVAEVFPEMPGVRRLTLECRGQGGSGPGDSAQFSIANFADDVVAFAESRGVERFVIGGISMGAAIALRIAVRHPERVSALILGRPAWAWDAAPPNMRVYAEVADFLRCLDAARALAEFELSATALELARDAPDNLASLRNFFAVKDRAMLAALLDAIAVDGPGIGDAEVRAIAVPTLVIGHGIDAVHPLGLAQMLAARITDSRLVEIVPKATDKMKYTSGFRAALGDFLLTLSKEMQFDRHEKPTPAT